jgi:AhpC/TSA family/Disulphide bond corrector protein DsbC
VERIRHEGLGLAAISYDSPAILKDFADRRKIAFPLLSDTDSKIIRAFGILNESVKPGTAQYGIPYPGTYIVDPQGKIVSKYFEDDYRERVSVSDILAGRYGERVDAANAAVEAKHIRLSTAASTPVAHPGHRILLTVDLDLKPKMHVYAPGVTGYIPVDWKLEDAGVAKVHPVQFPAAQKLLLKAIHETALVYQGRVRMTREITFAAENTLKPLVGPSGDVVIKGSFRYQACDDRKCYLPETVPVEWKFRFEALDRERVPAELQHKPR